MPGENGVEHEAESPAVAAFLRERRADVLARAISTVESCPPDALASESHRIAGTLGVFGLDDASAAARRLMQVAESDTSPAEQDEHRATTLAELRRIADEYQEGGTR